jgi:hypothetical protein
VGDETHVAGGLLRERSGGEIGNEGSWIAGHGERGDGQGTPRRGRALGSKTTRAVEEGAGSYQG